jgi:hypothetical protein
MPELALMCHASFGAGQRRQVRPCSDGRFLVGWPNHRSASRATISVIAAMPMTSTGKIQRHVLRQR